MIKRSLSFSFFLPCLLSFVFFFLRRGRTPPAPTKRKKKKKWVGGLGRGNRKTKEKGGGGGKLASTGNRTRVTRVAGEYSTTRPPMLHTKLFKMFQLQTAFHLIEFSTAWIFACELLSVDLSRGSAMIVGFLSQCFIFILNW